jgi:sensor c-di-GMP phosphodiesterase-like protein
MAGPACQFQPTSDTEADAGRQVRTGPRHALDAGQFRLVYQPVVDLSTGRIIAVEAPVR